MSRLTDLRKAMPEWRIESEGGIFFCAYRKAKNGKVYNIPIIWPRNKTAQNIADDTNQTWRDICSKWSL